MAFSKSASFDPDLQEFARLCQALAHPARLAIMKFLASSETCFCGDISAYLPLSPSTVSQHLKELKNAGLIQGTTTGIRKSYCINSDKWQLFCQFVDQFQADLAPVEIKKSCCS